jgi:clan AA aspartic protease
METAEMGRVQVEATIESLKDEWAVEQGLRKPDEVRKVTVRDALVDTGATMLSLPTSLVKQLGLKEFTKKRITSSDGGVRDVPVYEAVRLTIHERSCTIDVLEVPDNVPVLVGQVPLELLDFIVDMKSRSLVGNPAHGGEHMYEMY